MSKRHDYYIKVQHDHFDTAMPQHVGERAYQVYQVLKRFVWRNEEDGNQSIVGFARAGLLAVRLSTRKLATYVGITRRHLSRMLKQLDELGWIIRVPEKPQGGASNILVLGYVSTRGSVRPRRHEVFFADIYASFMYEEVEQYAESKYRSILHLDMADRLEVVDARSEAATALLQKIARNTNITGKITQILRDPEPGESWGILGTSGATTEHKPGARGSYNRGPGGHTTGDPGVIQPGTRVSPRIDNKERANDEHQTTNIPPQPPAAIATEDVVGDALSRAVESTPENFVEVEPPREELQGVGAVGQPSPRRSAFRPAERDEEPRSSWGSRKSSWGSGKPKAKAKSQPAYSKIPKRPKASAPPSIVGDDALEEVRAIVQKGKLKEGDALAKPKGKRRSDPWAKDLPLGMEAAIGRLGEVWQQALDARGKDEVQSPFRTEKVRWKTVELLEAYGEERLAGAVRYMVRNWDMLREAKKWKSVSPSVMVLYYYADDLVNEAKLYAGAQDAIDTWEEWRSKHPGRLRAPDEIQKPYMEAQKLRQQIGL